MDLLLVEAGGNGGDLVKSGNDLKVVYGFENFVYIALFGHRGGVTKSSYSNSEFRTDFWANSLLHPQEPAAQINSLTEDALHTIPLTSAGRLQIEEAIKADLAFMQKFAEITVNTAIIDTDKYRIDIVVKQPDNIVQKSFIFVWDSTLQELTQPGNNYVPNPNPVTDTALQSTLQFNL